MTNRIQIEPYHSRQIRFLELLLANGWKVKIYGICSEFATLDKDLVRIAKELANKVLPQPALNESRYGVAFIVIHQAILFHQIIVDWWERVNELRHHVFKSARLIPYSFKEITDTGEAFCVWELRVIAFERDAWLNVVLKSSDQNCIELYLTHQLNEDV